MFITNGTYPYVFLTQIFRNGQSSHGGDHTTVELMTLTLPLRTLG